MKTIFIILLSFAGLFIQAQSSVKNTTLITNCSLCSGTYSWTTTSPMDPTILFGGAGLSIDLQSKNYNFNIPAGASIVGIAVMTQYQSLFSSGPMYIIDTLVSLLKGGIVVGNSKHPLTAAYTATNVTTVNFGGSTDLWGTTWTPADINANNFGFNFKVYSNFPNLQLKLWQGIIITVYYSTTTGIIKSQSNSLRVENIQITNDNISFSGFENNENAEFSVFDMTGKKILSVNPNETNQISISQLPTGVYFYRTQIGDQISSAKFIVNR